VTPSLLRNSPCSPFRRRWLTRERFISSSSGRAGALGVEEMMDGAVTSLDDVEGLREKAGLGRGSLVPGHGGHRRRGRRDVSPTKDASPTKGASASVKTPSVDYAKTDVARSGLRAPSRACISELESGLFGDNSGDARRVLSWSASHAHELLEWHST
jgi:hypothetical protein